MSPTIYTWVDQSGDIRWSAVRPTLEHNQVVDISGVLLEHGDPKAFAVSPDGHVATGAVGDCLQRIYGGEK